MELTLHRQLKARYGAGGETEVALDGYRIDAVADGELVEVQRSSLSGLRDKLAVLLAGHRVRVVKPVVARKRLLLHEGRGGPLRHARWSPRRGSVLDAFDELVHLVRLLAHPRLVLDLLLVEIEEHRVAVDDRPRRRRAKGYDLVDQRLLSVVDCRTVRGPQQLAALVERDGLPQPFDTRDLARGLGIRRPLAQRIAYCLRELGVLVDAGRRRSGRLYRWSPTPEVGRASVT